MKSLYTMKIFVLATLLITIMVPVASAQARYKHIPRVKIDREIKTETKRFSEKPVVPFQELIHQKESEIVTPVQTENTGNTEVTTSTKEDNKVVIKKVSVIKRPRVIVHQTIPNRTKLASEAQEKNHLLDVKKQKKAALIGFLGWFIGTIILAVILLVLGIIFVAALAYALYYVFFIFGGVVFIVAVVLLILLLI
jgi:ABC-type glycerol-3-phosphate transport system permease component